MAQHKSFPAIEGMRAIFNFWIVALHQHMAQKTILALHKRIDLLEHISASVWPGIALGNGYQVDAFFMLSAFLFTWGVVSNTGDKDRTGLVARLRTIGLFVLKRVLRLWPVIVTVLAFAAVVNDYGARNPVSWVRALLIPTYFDDMPQAVVPGWSNRTDIENCVALFAVITVLQWTGCLNSFTAIVSVGLSLIPKAWRFLADPDTYSYMRLAEDVMTTAVTIPAKPQEFYRDVLFKGKLGSFESIDTVTRMTPMFYGEYIVTHQRWSPAFVGFALAVALRSAYLEFERSKGQKELSIWAKIGRVVSRLGSFVALLFSILFAALPILMALSPATAEVRATTLANPPIEADFVVSVLGRTLNAAGWAYLLYRCLLPKGHPLRLNYLAAFLELPVFQFIGRHTYCIYMLHYVIVHFVAFSILSPARMLVIMGPLSPDTLLLELLLRTVTSYGITFLLSISIVRYIEQPCLAAVQNAFKRLEGGAAAKKE